MRTRTANRQRKLRWMGLDTLGNRTVFPFLHFGVAPCVRFAARLSMRGRLPLTALSVQTSPETTLSVFLLSGQPPAQIPASPDTVPESDRSHGRVRRPYGLRFIIEFMPTDSIDVLPGKSERSARHIFTPDTVFIRK